MDCPICGEPAEDIANTIDGKTVRCPSCGDYDISGTVYDTGALQRVELAQRLAILGRAKRLAQAGERPMITSNLL